MTANLSEETSGLAVLVVGEARGEPLPDVDLGYVGSALAEGLRATGRFAAVGMNLDAHTAVACVQIVDHAGARHVRGVLSGPDGREWATPAFEVTTTDTETTAHAAYTAGTRLEVTPSSNFLQDLRDSRNPGYLAFLLLTAARLADRSALAAYGMQLAPAGRSCRDLNAITLGLEALALGGAPSSVGTFLFDLLVQDTWMDADTRLRLEHRGGGIRAWIALGEVRVLTATVWMAREVTRFRIDPAYRTDEVVNRIASVLARFRAAGMPHAAPNPDDVLHVTLRGSWGAHLVPRTLGGAADKLYRTVSAVTEAVLTRRDLPREAIAGGRLAVETFLGAPAPWVSDASLPVPVSDLANAIFTRPEAVDRFYTDAARQAGDIALREGDLPRAQRHYEQACAAQPGEGEILATLGNLLAMSHKSAEASRVVGLALAHHGCAVLHGGIAIDQGDYDRGIAEMDEILRVDPLHVQARMFRARARVKRGDHAGASVDAAMVRLLKNLNAHDVEGFLRGAGL